MNLMDIGGVILVIVSYDAVKYVVRWIFEPTPLVKYDEPDTQCHCTSRDSVLPDISSGAPIPRKPGYYVPPRPPRNP